MTGSAGAAPPHCVGACRLATQHTATTAGNRDRKRKGWDSNATGQSAAAEPGGTAVLFR